MDLWPALFIVCPVAFVGGAINSIAGGATLLTFPALMYALESSGLGGGMAILANGTNKVALCPAAFSGAWGFRRELRSLGSHVLRLAIPSLIGAAAGTILVVSSGEKSFRAMVPWLIAAATLLLIFQPQITAMQSRLQKTSDTFGSSGLVYGLQFLIGVYGGYFGAGIGILMITSLSLLRIGDIHQINALKNILGGVINGVAMIIFLYNGEVVWKLAVPMMAAAVVGGWLGAEGARRLDRGHVRRIIIATGITLTVWYFAKIYFLANPIDTMTPPQTQSPSVQPGPTD